MNNTLGHLRGMGVMESSPRTCNVLCQMEDDRLKPLKENEEESRCCLKCPTECPDLPPYPTNSTPLLITNGQGLVEIHVLSLQLATSVSKKKKKKSVGNISI